MAGLRNPYDSTDQFNEFDPSQFLAGDQNYPGSSNPTAPAPPAPIDPIARDKVQPVPTAGNGATPAPPAPSAGPSGSEIDAIYNQFLGRSAGTQGGDRAYETGWEAGDPNWQDTVKNSPEAQGYARRQPQAAPQAQQNFGPTLPGHAGLDAQLQKIIDSGGQFNQDIVNRRTENARETLGRQRSSTLKNDQAALASRGLMGSGPEADALNYLDTNIGNQYQNAVSGIYANESQNADQRMMSALQQSTGLSEADAQNAINSFSADTARRLGLGNLALGNSNSANNYNLGLGQLGLQRDVALNNADNAQVDQLIQLLQQLHLGAANSAKGYY